MDPKARFSDRAVAYVAGRPSYPEAAIDALFAGLPPEPVVIDLGAGTGIATRLLAERASRVYAVEPNAAMREHAATVANVVWTPTSAEETGLARGAADLVTAFQAFHWFEATRALREMERIVRPGGRVALVYNERDEGDATSFASAYGRLVATYKTDETERQRAHGREAFLAHAGWERARVLEFRSSTPMDRATVRARATSTSYLPHEGVAYEAMCAELDRIFDRAARDGIANMTHVTIAIVADVRA